MSRSTPRINKYKKTKQTKNPGLSLHFLTALKYIKSEMWVAAEVSTEEAEAGPVLAQVCN